LPSSLLVTPTCHKLISPQNVLNLLDQLIFSIVTNNDTKPKRNFLVHNNNKICHLHNYNPRMEEIGFQSNPQVIWNNLKRTLINAFTQCTKTNPKVQTMVQENVESHGCFHDEMVILPNQRHSFSTKNSNKNKQTCMKCGWLFVRHGD
jgi:hypothetical protein